MNVLLSIMWQLSLVVKEHVFVSLFPQRTVEVFYHKFYGFLYRKEKTLDLVQKNFITTYLFINKKWGKK